MSSVLVVNRSLFDALERHYARQLMRYTRMRSSPTPPPDITDIHSADLPF
jgi:hypothetical protein